MEPRTTAPLHPSSELKLRFKWVEEMIRTAPSSLPPTPSEEKREINSNKRVVEEMIAAPSRLEEEARKKRMGREERIVPPPLSSEEKRRIKEVAQRVVHDDDGHVTEKLLLRLLSMTRNRARWGFLSPDHPVHPYYLQRKDIERCRVLRSQNPAAGDPSR